MAEASGLDTPEPALKLKKKKKKLSAPREKSKSSVWDSSLCWKDVTPEDPFAILAGSDEGGFMCLEEIDGDTYYQVNGNSLELPGDGQGKKTEKTKKDRLPKSTEVSELEPLHSSTKSKKRKRSDKKEKRKANHNDASEPDEQARSKKVKCTKEDKTHESSDMHEAQNCSTAQTGGVNLSDPRENVENAGLMISDLGQNVSSIDCSEHRCEENLDDLPAWAELRLHWKIIKALAALKFTQPTLIQKSCIHAAAHQGKDVIGAAETGSGKTLAYVIPILQRLMEEEERDNTSTGHGKVVNGIHSRKNQSGSPLRALIVAPTRELALQVCEHFREAAKFTTIKVVPIVGGMSTQKQERLLKQRPHAIVGTPGRLWELISAGEKHLVELDSVSFFVLDEADRLVEKGHFQELQSIIGLLPAEEQETRTDQERVENDDDVSMKAVGGFPRISTEKLYAADVEIGRTFKRRQTFVFSATLALPPGFRKKLKKDFLRVRSLAKNEQCSVAALSERAGVRHNAAIVNLTSQNILVDKLEESTIYCREEEKDKYLYYILNLHGCGRTIVFCTSIAAVRRVAALLHLLQIQARPLHAQMQQRQRLKAMDRFRVDENSVLIATDLAARGLDIQGVRTVIHYQLPHSAEVYVHRSGRTARASQDGCSILLVSPPDQRKYSSLCHELGKKDRLPMFPINNGYIPAIVKRIELAQQIDTLLRKNAQTRAKTNWLRRNADALEIDVEDSGKGQEESDLSETHLSGKQGHIQLKRLQQELNRMLEQPLEPKSFSHRFIAGAGISPLVAGQLKDYAKQKMVNRHGNSGERSNPARSKTGRGRKGLVVIGQETIEALAALRTSTLL